jgi:subtilisin family serine protease
MKKIRYFNLLAALALVLTALPLAKPVRAEGSSPDLSRDMQFVPGEALVAFEEGQDTAAYSAQATALADTVGAQVVRQDAGLALLSFAPDADVAAVVDEISAQAGVAFAEPNYIAYSPDAINGTAVPLMSVDYQTTSGGTLTLTADMLRGMRTEASVNGVIQAVPAYPDDSFNNWSYNKIGADIIWPDRSANPTVCVVDTGVDSNHPDLSGYVINGQDYVNGDLVPEDDNGHGTHVAGTIAARMNNGADTVAGISTGKVLAVKVLDSAGVGTAFNISAGIRYCADHGAKIINLSLGGYSPSLAEYNALRYAEVSKGLFVVAAAGNDSQSASFFPAAWSSSSICKDGSPAPCGASSDPNAPNALASGLISVAAARSLQTNDSDSAIWVDANGDSVEDLGEDLSDCATDFSNYGAWVSMVAPGEDILSTVPVSNPYSLSSSLEDLGGYAGLSGTSMAAAHVSGAAARVWSIGAKLFGATATRQKVKTQLIQWSNPLNIAQDSNWADSGGGYNNGSYAGDGPYCWPTSMSSARYLNVARAMQRMSIGAVLLVDANTSGPLQGAKVTVNLKGSTTILDTSIVSSASPFVDLLNIPANGTTAKTYEVKVSKTGYTSGTLKIGEIRVTASMSGLSWSGDNLSMAIPQNTGITVVATWFNKQAYISKGELRDLDFYLWVPKNKCSSTWPTPTDAPCIVGPKQSPAGLTDYAWFGSLSAKPFARSFFDGGSTFLSPAGTIPVGSETINLKATTTTSTPYLKPYYAGTYTFVLTDNNHSWLHDTAYPVIVRVWIKGKPYKTVKIPPSNCSGNAWKALTISGTTYKLGSSATAFGTLPTCGDFSQYASPGNTSGLWPYQ